MNTYYHNNHHDFKIPSTWVKDETFIPCIEMEQNDPNIRYRLISKYEERRGLLRTICKIIIGIFFSLALIPLRLKSGRKFINSLLYNNDDKCHILREVTNLKKIVHVYVRMAANPPHLGHMQMIALGIDRCAKEEWGVSQVHIICDESYTENKVKWCNASIERHNQNPLEQPEMSKINIPSEKRRDWLHVLIEQAQKEGY